MKAFLQRKGVSLSAKEYFITALSFMALGLFSSLIIGLIIKTIGEQLDFPFFIDMGQFAMSMTGPAIGGAVAYGLKAPPLVIFGSIITGAAGNELGGPAGSYAAALLSSEFGKIVSKETKIDIIVTPFVTIAVGYTAAAIIGPSIASFMQAFGSWIMWATELRPFLMGIIVAILMGWALTAPISSVAIALMLDLKGIAAGAATVGCAAQMIGFAVSSYRENGFGGFVAQGIGTSMLQVANIIRNPIILIPPTIAGAMLAPLATVWFNMVNHPSGAGMGTSGLVGQIMTFTEMGFSVEVLLKVLLLHIVGPAVISLVLSELLRKAGLIKFGDMKIDY